MDNRFGLAQQCIEDIINVFKLQPEIEEAVMFGSRAMGNYKKASDIDIALKGDKVDFDTISNVRVRLDELPYAYTYDIINYQKISNESVVAHIDELGISFYKKEKVPGNWKTYKLCEIAEINPRVSLKQGKEYSFVEMKDLNASLKYVKPSAKRELKGGAKFQNRDTLFARITPCLENGKICQVKDLDDGVGFGSTEFMIFRGKENLSDTDFIYYLTRTDFVRNNAIQAMTGTSGRQRVEKSALEKIEVVAPDLKTQQSIASILSSLDDKIELNLQMNQTLETMAQAIFKEWFVNFNFPGFDGELVDGLPKRWSNKMIKEVGKVVTGNTPSSNNPEYFGEITPFITPTDFKNFGKLIIDADRYLSNEGRLAMTTRLLSKNSVLVTCIGSDMGKVALNKIECVTNQQINSIIPDEKVISADYLYYDLVFKYDYLRNIATGGSTMPIINKSRFEQIEIVVPQYEVVKSFQLLMNDLNSKNEENIRQIRVLTQIRDGLLPKLMTGKIEVMA